MLSRLPFQVDGAKYLLLKRIPRYSNVPSTTPRSTASRTRLCGMKRTAWLKFPNDSENTKRRPWSLPARRGEVRLSFPPNRCSTTNVFIFLGPGYRDAAIFNLSTMEPYSLDQLHTTFSKVTKEIVLFLPRTSDLNQLAKYNDRDEKIEVLHYCQDGASKVICLYLTRRSLLMVAGLVRILW
jgi:hypothetical protein